MAYDRRGTGPWAWIKVVGTQEEPLDPDWRLVDRDLLHRVFFSKRPRSIREGDILVYYAAHHGTFVALMRVESDEVLPHPEEERWNFSMTVRPLLTLPLWEAPTIYDTPIKPIRVRRQSHISLDDQEFLAIRDLMSAKMVELTSVE